MSTTTETKHTCNEPSRLHDALCNACESAADTSADATCSAANCIELAETVQGIALDYCFGHMTNHEYAVLGARIVFANTSNSTEARNAAEDWLKQHGREVAR